MAADVERKRSKRGGSSLTIKEVSLAAGVSTATVSRILNTPELVSNETKRLVESAINRMGYRPNPAARALAARRSYTIGAIVPSISNALYAVMLDAFKSALEQSNYDLLLSSFDYDASKVLPKVEKFVQRGVDAIFIASVEYDADVVELLDERGIPFTTTWLSDTASSVPRIVYDHRAAALRPAQYLCELGHRQFALLTGTLKRNRRLDERHCAIVDLLRDRGIAAHDISTIEVPTYDLKCAREGFRTLLGKPVRPTAIIASNDIVAAGVILECHAQGIHVPGEISVTGFGDIDIAAHFHPPISTIRTPRAVVGAKAAEYLVSKLAGKNPSGQTNLDFEFIVRDTTGPRMRSGATG